MCNSDRLKHDLHVSPDLVGLPAEWVDTLRAQGMTEQDLLLITAAKRAQRGANNALYCDTKAHSVSIRADRDRDLKYAGLATSASIIESGSISWSPTETRSRLPTHSDERDEDLMPLGFAMARPRPVPTRNLKRLSDQIKVFSQFNFDGVGRMTGPTSF